MVRFVCQGHGSLKAQRTLISKEGALSQVEGPVQTPLPPHLHCKDALPLHSGLLGLTSECRNSKIPVVYFGFSSEAFLIMTLLLRESGSSLGGANLRS